ncbi:MAG: tandem-95 repeat protein [Bacteroidota bacterium]
MEVITYSRTGITHVNYSTKLTYLLVPFSFLLTLFITVSASAQTAATKVVANYEDVNDSSNDYSITGTGQSDYSASTTYNMSFSSSSTTSNNLVLDYVEVGTNRFFPSDSIATPIFRRNNNSTWTGKIEFIWMERNSFSSPNLDLKPEFVSTMEEALNSKVINRGTDNVFTNPSTNNGNNIERLDYVYENGLTPADVTTQGFLLLERNGNDNIKIAPILAIDGSNNPTAYGNLINIGSGSTYWGSSPHNITTITLRDNDPSTNSTIQPNETVSSQNVKACVITFDDLGISNGATIYGYSLFANDVTNGGDNTNLLDWTNTTYFPQNTSSTNGGSDLIAGGIHITKADVDQDGVIDENDLDDDNDGIPDYEETCGLGATSFVCANNPGGLDPSGDDDGDGVPNYADADYCTLNANGVCTTLDTDGDGIIDQYDKDADGDGCMDFLEVNSTDGNNDGTVDNFSDTNKNGLSDNVDPTAGGTALTLGDENSNGTLDFQEAATTTKPISVDDIASTSPNTSLIISVLNNDYSCAGFDESSISNSGLVAPANGSISLNTTNGEVTYTPSLNFTGTDVFEYQICDVATPAKCDTATVTVNVVNSTYALNDINQVPRDSMVNGNVITNDRDFEGNAQTVNNATVDSNGDGSDNNTLTFGSATNIYGTNESGSTALAGSITLQTDGNYTFDAASGFTGEVALNYEKCDDGSPSACADAILTIAVFANELEDNDPPVAQNDVISTEEGITVSSNVITPNDSDPEGDDLTIIGMQIDTDGDGTPDAAATVGDQVTVAGVDDSGASILNAGTLELESNGAYTFIPMSGFVGKINAEYTLSDDNASTDKANLAIHVYFSSPLQNDVYAHDDASVSNINEGQTGNLLTNDFSPEGNGIAPTTGTFNLTNGGTLVIASDGDYTYTPATDFVGTEVFVYTVCDAIAPPGCDEATLYLTTLPFNETFATDDFNNTPFGTPVVSNVLTNDTDPEGNTQSGNVALLQDVPGTDGTLILNADGSYTFTPAANFSGQTSFQYKVCDDGVPVECDSAFVYIEVLPQLNTTNTALVANNDVQSTKQDITTTGNVVSNDIDPELTSFTVASIFADTDGDGLVDDAMTVGALTTVYGVDKDGNITNAAELTLNADGTYTVDPKPWFEGEIPVDYTITDENNDTDQARLTIDVIANSGNTTFATDDAQMTDLGIPISASILTNDQDVESNATSVTAFKMDADGNGLIDDAGTLGLDNTVYGINESGAKVVAGTFNLMTNGNYTFTPAMNFKGNVEITYTVCDNVTPTAACAEATLDITVQGANRDFSDAPNTYPEAWHRAMTDANNDKILDGTSDVWLGNQTSFETNATPDADQHDDAMILGTASGQFPTSNLSPSTTYGVDITLNSASSTTVHYGMWIDWDNDGTYEDFYNGSALVNGATIQTVNITSPASVSPEVNIRLRVDDNALVSADYQGGKTNGEVEDYQKSAAALPVELSYFRVENKDCIAQLTWRTESEVDFDYFEIQKSTDGISFKTIQTVDGRGGIQPAFYTAEDTDVNDLGTVYYRLRIVDLDGSYEYSGIQLLQFNCTINSSSLSVYPNPITEGQRKVTIELTSPRTSEVLKVVDINGRIVYQTQLELTSNDKKKVELNLFNLSAGHYTISVGQLHQRIVITE